MEFCNALNLERDMEDLFVSRFQNRAAAAARLRYDYDPENTVCAVEQGVLLGAVLISFRNAHLEGKDVLAAWIDAPVLREENEELETALLHLAFEKALHNALIILSEVPVVQNTAGCVLSTLYAADLVRTFSQTSLQTVTRFDGKENLYPLYRSFADRFDTSIVLFEDEFERLAALWKKSGLQLIAARNPDWKPAAFCTLQSENGKIILDHFVYEDPKALHSLITWTLGRYQNIEVRYTGAERFEQIAGLSGIHERGKVYLACDPFLLGAFYHKEEEPLENLLALSLLPSWNSIH
jgi:hypothetical protein